MLTEKIKSEKTKSMRKSKFDKYFHYKESVQSPETDISFFNKTYRSFYNKKPLSFREDFCGTFALGTDWVQLSRHHQAFVVDHDKKPLAYGKTHHLPLLDRQQKKQLHIFNKDVLSKSLPGADIISVSNFSYFVFKEREMMLKYFQGVRRKLAAKGLFIIDIFGGSEVHQNSEEAVKHDTFTYYWEQSHFNPIDNSARFAIHFKRKGEKKRRNTFIYNWRLWSLPEIKDLLKEAGFAESFVYWEGFDRKGDGTGVFKKKNQGEICDTWLAYLVSLP